MSSRSNDVLELLRKGLQAKLANQLAHVPAKVRQAVQAFRTFDLDLGIVPALHQWEALNFFGTCVLPVSRGFGAARILPRRS